MIMNYGYNKLIFTIELNSYIIIKKSRNKFNIPSRVNLI